jgi:hypothetical protein
MNKEVILKDMWQELLLAPQCYFTLLPCVIDLEFVSRKLSKYAGDLM